MAAVFSNPQQCEVALCYHQAHAVDQPQNGGRTIVSAGYIFTDRYRLKFHIASATPTRTSSLQRAPTSRDNIPWVLVVQLPRWSGVVTRLYEFDVFDEL